MKAEVIILIAFVILVIVALIMRPKYREKASKNPKLQKTMGYILIILPCLAFILNLIADLLEGKVNTLSLILQTIGTVCLLVLGIRLIKGKENPLKDN